MPRALPLEPSPTLHKIVHKKTRAPPSIQMSFKDSLVPRKVVMTPYHYVGPRGPRILGTAILDRVSTEATEIVKVRFKNERSASPLSRERAGLLLDSGFWQRPGRDLGRGAMHTDAGRFIREYLPFSAPHHRSKENVMEFTTSPGNVSHPMGLLDLFPNATAKVFTITIHWARPTSLISTRTNT